MSTKPRQAHYDDGEANTALSVLCALSRTLVPARATDRFTFEANVRETSSGKASTVVAQGEGRTWIGFPIVVLPFVPSAVATLDHRVIRSATRNRNPRHGAAVSWGTEVSN